MAAREVALDAAAFLDSPRARSLPGSREDVRRIVEHLLSACYEDLGKAPRLLDGEDVHVVLGHVLPGRFAKGDALAERVPAVLAAYLDHLVETEVVLNEFEIRRALEATLPEFQEAVRTGREAHHHGAEKGTPFVHGARKLGRNDPCSCGSGKKYKKCHGKES
jgi:uncharacterized protein YecA (UPF0149 family)